MDLRFFLVENWKLITGLTFLFFFLVLAIIINREREKTEKKVQVGFLVCPLRGSLRVKKYDTKGGLTEEYQRIRLITYFLKKGYPKSWFKWEYPIEKSFGHKGRSKVKIIIDLVIKKGNKFLIVAEVKKNYHPEKKRSALEHQLKPAMAWTRSKYGVYWDGTSKSCCLIRGERGEVLEYPFP
jgi:hypothetical protein